MAPVCLQLFDGKMLFALSKSMTGNITNMPYLLYPTSIAQSHIMQFISSPRNLMQGTIYTSESILQKNFFPMENFGHS